MKTYYIHNFQNLVNTFNLNNYHFKKYKKPTENSFGDVVTYKCYYSKEAENPSALYRDKTELDDICLLLSLYFGYDIYYTDSKTKRIIFADCRCFNLNMLSFSFTCTYPDLPFYRAIKRVLCTIKDDTWLTQYNNGSHLKLLKEALKEQSRESQYLNCFIIWEHLFYLHNHSVLSERQLRNTKAKDKLSYLLLRYKFDYNSKQIEKLQELANIRHKIVHEGVVPEYIHYPEEIWIFCELTQFLVAKTLNLRIGSITDSERRFKEFLNEPPNTSALI